ncbi:hypothetical protein HPT29_012590 [Microvirga terrae]|uniref:Uncharacterized protein n=1 Tax=Microvirga terrae TaxID=2740529 RepID=A0ABY5RNJ2_9HYPH|nr:hypothetical protein [Microvirga terrae]UVF17392.1 hypothetical protein HPT29_012590 [Microvirga terrae]
MDRLVITGLVPVIPMKNGVALHAIGMAGTSPAMTWEAMAPGALHSRGKR